MYEYGSDFYHYNGSFGGQSARRVVPLLTDVLPIHSVADFGCGRGAWLSVWQEAGVSVVGVDGPHAEVGRRLVEQGAFRAADLGEPIDLGQRFDLVQSLEVAEHLPAAQAGQFIDNLVSHGACVLFSAAVPGQGGEHHVNEQPLGYWRRKFREHGYHAFDYLRPLIADDRAVQSWYRYNTLLYIREDRIAGLPPRLRLSRVPGSADIADYRPLANRLRNAMVRRLPGAAVDRLSRVRAGLATRLA
jgi:SAM-dependent methyltransferase